MQDTQPALRMIMPPPNVTGSLHLGHALNLFIQDVIVRFYSLKGENITWVPGTDHGGIGTQSLVQNRFQIDSSDAKLLEQVWEWARHSEQLICDQVKEMNLSLDWNTYTFSFDVKVQEAVKEAFCRLYEKGLIYKAKRMVNWDVKLQTVISDIETVTKELEGQMYYIRYKYIGGEVLVGTTRPETIFADQALAVHPEDARYMHLIGKSFQVPLIDRLVPMVPYSGCSLDVGTGIVKIDPPHGFLDFEIGQKFNLPIESILDNQGKMCNVPEELIGLDRFEARSKVIQMLQENGDLIKIETIKHMVPHGIKSDSVLEPYLSDQWFFDLPKLKSDCISALNQVILHPSRFSSLYSHYVSNLQPWCISRQIVWGHPIPAYYDEEGQWYVARSLEEAQLKANGKKLTPDPDVLDTWFSSGLWPMVTGGWPEKLDGYPNFCLITGSDILFFWVLKMISMGIALDTGIPFKHVLLHGLVQDEYGLKMSKSKGNTLEPITLIREHGSDVLRFGLVASAVAGNNIKFGKPSIDMARKFTIKIENAFTFCLKYLKESQIQASMEAMHPINHWILINIEYTEQKIKEYMDDWDLYHASTTIYDFFWDPFCSWYIECTKVLMLEYKNETNTVLFYCCRRILKLLYPFLPEISMKYWNLFKFDKSEKDLRIEDDIPELSHPRVTDFTSIQRIISLIRSLKSHFIIKELHISSNINQIYKSIISKLTNTSIKFLPIEDEVRFACGDYVIGIPSLSIIETKQQIEHIIQKLEVERIYLQDKLLDAGFVKNCSESDLTQKQCRLSDILTELEVYNSMGRV